MLLMCKFLDFNFIKITLDVHQSPLPLNAQCSLQLLSTVFCCEILM